MKATRRVSANATPGLKLRTGVKAAYRYPNHNETLVPDAAKPGVKVRTTVKASGTSVRRSSAIGRSGLGLDLRTGAKAIGVRRNHNETLMRDAAKPGVKVRTAVKAGATGIRK
jgi:hypothetical protein